MSSRKVNKGFTSERLQAWARLAAYKELEVKASYGSDIESDAFIPGSELQHQWTDILMQASVHLRSRT